jgi:hypothetical protein
MIYVLVTEDEFSYPEVRSVVANTDGPAMLVSTFRAWVLGIIWVIIIPVSTSSSIIDILPSRSAAKASGRPRRRPPSI